METPTIKKTSKAAKKQNIFIGISLGKKLTQEDIHDYLSWAKEHASKVAVLIADDLNAINYEVFHGYSHASAIKKSHKEGNKIKNLILEVTQEDPNLTEIEILHWKDITSAKLTKAKEILSHALEENPSFKKDIFNLIEKYLARRTHVPPGIDKTKLADYILWELPTLLYGVKSKNNEYTAILYPSYKGTELSNLAIKIRDGYWPGLTQKLASIAQVTFIEIEIRE